MFSQEQCENFKNTFFEGRMLLNRSGRPEVVCKKRVLKNFSKFTGKHLCRSLFFNKVAGLRSATLLKKRLWHRCFPVDFEKFLRTPFFIEHLWWLLLSRPFRLLPCMTILPVMYFGKRPFLRFKKIPLNSSFSKVF